MYEQDLAKLLFTLLSALVLVATAIYGRWTSSLCGKGWVIPNNLFAHSLMVSTIDI